MRAVLSSEAVTIRDPSGLKAAEITWPSWSLRTAISLAVDASQIRAVLSSEAVTIRDPSLLCAKIEMIEPGCEAELIADIGGAPTFAQKMLIRRCARGMLRLAEP
jgi:hypothetical protein